MRSSTIALVVGLFAAPLALVSDPSGSIPSVGLIGEASAQSVGNRTPDSVNGRRLENAPVPGVDLPGVPAIDRFGGTGSRTVEGAGPSNATPFSDTPSGTLSAGGADIAESDRTLQPQQGRTTTPNLSR